MKTPHVLQVCHTYEAPFLDCAAQFVRLLESSAYAVTTVYLKGRADLEAARRTGGSEVVFLESTARDLRGLRHRQARELKELARGRVFSFAVAHRYKPIHLCAQLGELFTVGVHHAFGDYERWHRRVFVQRHAERLALLGVSDAVRDDLRSSLPRLSPERIQTLYNRVDPTAVKRLQLDRLSARKALGVAADAYVFGTVGRLHPDKDPVTLLRAFAANASDLADAVLVLVGKGRLEGELKSLAARLAVERRVVFAGEVPDAVKYFAAFDAFVLSSEREPFGMVLLEAMCAGLPLATSDRGGGREVVADTGLLVPPHDVAALARAMRELHAMPEHEVATRQARMMRRVREHFSDAAALRAFWRLPFMERFANGRYGESPHGPAAPGNSETTKA